MKNEFFQWFVVYGSDDESDEDIEQGLMDDKEPGASDKRSGAKNDNRSITRPGTKNARSNKKRSNSKGLGIMGDNMVHDPNLMEEAKRPLTGVDPVVMITLKFLLMIMIVYNLRKQKREVIRGSVSS